MTASSAAMMASLFDVAGVVGSISTGLLCDTVFGGRMVGTVLPFVIATALAFGGWGIVCVAEKVRYLIRQCLPLYHRHTSAAPHPRTHVWRAGGECNQRWLCAGGWSESACGSHSGDVSRRLLHCRPRWSAGGRCDQELV